MIKRIGFVVMPLFYTVVFLVFMAVVWLAVLAGVMVRMFGEGEQTSEKPSWTPVRRPVLVTENKRTMGADSFIVG